MKKIILFLALCFALHSCFYSGSITKKEAYAAPVIENTYSITSPTATSVAGEGGNTNIVFKINRTVTTGTKNVTFILSYTHPLTGFLINDDRYESFEKGESSMPVQMTIPNGAKVSLILFEQDNTGTYRSKEVGGKDMIRVI